MLSFPYLFCQSFSLILKKSSILPRKLWNIIIENVHLKLYLTEECVVWGKTFKRKSNLRRHEIAHADVKSYQCEFCPASFKWILKWEWTKIRGIIDNSIIMLNLIENKWLILLRSFFNQKSNLNRHKMIHGNEKFYKCDQCEKNYISKHFVSSYVREAQRWKTI